MRVLIADDDPALLTALPPLLRKEGHRVYLREIVGDLPDFILAQGIDLVILEPALVPFSLSLDICRAIRLQKAAMLLVVSRLTSVTERVMVLRAGADDYLTKPFDSDELLARVCALSRRHPLNAFGNGGGITQVTPELWLDLAARRLFDRNKKETLLTEREFRLLAYLVLHEGTALSRDTLLEAVWGSGYEGLTREVDVFVRFLRLKVEPDPPNPQYILSVWGMGYTYKRPVSDGDETAGHLQGRLGETPAEKY